MSYILFGKNFKDSDQDIAMDIKYICSNSDAKNVIYINPDSTGSNGQEWVSYHNSILNASSYKCYTDLPEYIAGL